MKYRHPPASARGFSLIEVMVAVLVISIGLLGIAKMQALALSNTSTSRLRALAALETTSLASTMQADRAYWAVKPLATQPFSVVINGTTITSTSDSTLNTTPTCMGGTVCTPDDMAAFDFQNWITALNQIIPDPQTSISCTVPATTGVVTCSISVGWTENLVNANSGEVANQAAAKAALATPQFVMVVQP